MEVYLDGVAIPKLDKHCYDANMQESAGIKEQILKRHFQQIENILQQHFNVFSEEHVVQSGVPVWDAMKELTKGVEVDLDAPLEDEE